MKVYYFYNEDDDEPEKNDWNIFNLCIPYGPPQNKTVVVLNLESGIKGLSKMNFDDTIKLWPFTLPIEVYREFIKAALEGKV